MLSAKQARFNSLTIEQFTEMQDIFTKISVQASKQNGQRQVLVATFSSELIWDILKTDYGYSVRTVQRGILISW